MKERLKQLGSLLRAYPAAICFLVFITGFMVLDMCWPTREFSELENTMLDQKPAFSFQALFSNQWTADYGEYVKDQIALRDSWIDLQSRSESLLLQKAEIGGILIGKDRQLFTEMFTLTRTEQRTLPNNISALEQFAQRHGDKVTVLIAPSASVIYPEKLPFAAPMLDEDGWLAVSMIGNLLVKRYPDFDVRNFGFSKLTPFVLSLGIFEVRTERGKDNARQA